MKMCGERDKQSLEKQAKDDISMQLIELFTNDMLIAFSPIYINWQSYLSIPISTASAE